MPLDTDTLPPESVVEEASQTTEPSMIATRMLFSASPQESHLLRRG